MSQCQAAVQHGFSISKDVLKSIISPETVISKRIEKDYLLLYDISQLNPHTFDVNNSTIAFQSVGCKYKIHWESN